MKKQELKEIYATLTRGRRLYVYFKDRYALELLRLSISDAVGVAAVRRSTLANLLNKPIVTDTIAGDGVVDPMKLACVWRDGAEIYRLSVGAWRSSYDSYGQTSRPGYNLVLRLNFSNQHDTEYRRLIDKKDRRPFVFEDHPVSRRRWHTLAWSRLDIDLRTGEALIEEVQNDWLRYATSALRRAKPGRSVVWYCGVRMDARNLETYVNRILDTHKRMWDEAMLMASIGFLTETLGVRTIFYHTHKSGAELKRIDWGLPPKSIYEALPKRFCFRLTDSKPSFLHVKSRQSKRRKRIDAAQFRVLEL